MDSHGGQIRGQMAHQAARGELSDRARGVPHARRGHAGDPQRTGSTTSPCDTGAEPLGERHRRARVATERGAGPAATGRSPSERPAPRRPPCRAGTDGASSIPPARGGNGSSRDGGAR